MSADTNKSSVGEQKPTESTSKLRGRKNRRANKKKKGQEFDEKHHGQSSSKRGLRRVMTEKEAGGSLKTYGSERRSGTRKR